MKKIIYLFLTTTTLFIGCVTKKTVQNKISNGDYDSAIHTIISKIGSNKNNPKYEQYVLFLEESFAKAQQRNLEEIRYLKGGESNPKRIFELYNELKKRQNRIKPLTPLYLKSKRRNAHFDFKNFDTEIASAKNSYINFLNKKGTDFLNSSNKYDARKAYDSFVQIEKLNPNYYNNIQDLKNQAHQKGTDFIQLNIKNNTEQIIPKRLLEELTQIDTYGLNDFWTVYHETPVNNVNYDYGINLVFKKINISPEQVKERELIKERQVKDGWEYLVQNGAVVKDSLGQPIKIDKFKTVRSTIYEFTQFKSAQVIGDVETTHYNTNQLIQVYPLESTFVFEHIYANYKGNKAALDEHYLNLIGLRAVRFPSNEQMVYDTGTNLKSKLKKILTQHRWK